MNSLPFVFLALLVAVCVTNAGEVSVHVHEHTAGNDEVGDKVDGYVPNSDLPYEVSADQKRYEDDPEGGVDEEDDH